MMNSSISPPVAHRTNAEQAAAWNGDQGAYWAAHADRFDAAVERYDQPFFHAAALQEDSRVLDIGCGSGGTTRAAARCAAEGHALGVDLSTEMIAVARTLAARERLTNAHFLSADAQVHPFDESAFDVAISRTGAMFFGQPDQAFSNIARAIVPGGRLVLMTWQPSPRNEWLTTFATALTGHVPEPAPARQPGPFSLSEPDDVRILLEGSGFAEVTFDGVIEPMYYGRNADDAFQFVVGLLGWMVRDLDETSAATALQRLRSTLEDRTTRDGVLLGSAAWIITARRP
jgi:SAM-dependent methyltransferase